MSYGQGGPGPQQWDPWKPHSQQPDAAAPQPWSQGGSGNPGEPDWEALAEASAAKAKRRRIVAAAVAAVVVVAGAVTAVLLTRGGDDPGPVAGSGGTSASGSTGTPSFAPTSAPPPLDPEEILADSRKDTAPLSPAALFPGKAGGKLTLGEAAYTKGPSAETADCASAAQHTLPKVLADHGCTKMLRATYTRDGVAVTVGVAVFDNAEDATAAREQSDKSAIIAPLSGKGVKPFCDGAVCRSTINSYGRYTYFTITGFTDGKDVKAQDKEVFDAGDHLAHYAFQQIHRRGEAQATVAPAQ